MLIDTHAHLDFEDFEKDLDETVRRAIDAGVGIMINPGINVPSSRKAVAIAELFDCVYAAAGIHAHDVADCSPDVIDEIARIAEHPKVVAVGECGLDFFRNYAPRARQLEVFRDQVRLALRLGKPLVVHSRGAEEETLQVLTEERAELVGGVLHCLGGAPDQPLRAQILGFVVGVGGTLTYPRSDRRDFVANVDIHSIVLETDAPFLPPEPHRGKRNEPAWLPLVAQKLAETRSLPLDDVHRITSSNAERLFRIGMADPARTSSFPSATAPRSG